MTSWHSKLWLNLLLHSTNDQITPLKRCTQLHQQSLWIHAQLLTCHPPSQSFAPQTLQIPHAEKAVGASRQRFFPSRRESVPPHPAHLLLWSSGQLSARALPGSVTGSRRSQSGLGVTTPSPHRYPREKLLARSDLFRQRTPTAGTLLLPCELKITRSGEIVPGCELFAKEKKK